MDKSDARAIKYIAVGSKTAEFLKNYGIDAIVPQGEFSADGLIDYFKNIDVKDKNILIPVPETHSDKFKNYLITNGALVETVVIYKTSKIKYEEGYVKNFITENKIDTVVFASPSAAESFFMNFHEDSFINKLNFISIGKTTYNFLKNSLNIDSYYPEEYTIYGVVLLLQELRRTK
jgi:uroporphyrinogen-III synthase